jgi:hypothetical protein
MSDVERIADALRDVQGAYYCPPLDPYTIQGAVAFTVAAKSSLRRCFILVKVTTPTAPRSPLPTKFAVAEKHIAGLSSVAEIAQMSPKSCGFLDRRSH